MTKITVSLYNLFVEVESDFKYPDQVQDMANRASWLFVTALSSAKEAGIDLAKLTLEEFDEEED